MAHKGKKVFTWNYEEGGSIKIPIPVYMVQDGKMRARDSNEKGTFFYVEINTEQIPQLYAEGRDIDQLKKDVFLLVKEKLHLTWEGKLLVEIGGSRTRLYDHKDGPDTLATEDDARASVNLAWTRIQITKVGTKKKYRRFNSYYDPRDYGRSDEPGKENWSQMMDGWPDTGPKKNRFDDDTGDYVAMIDDTPEHRQALEAIAGGMEELHKRLAGLLKQDSIVATLAAVKTQPLLPGAEKEFDAPEPRKPEEQLPDEAEDEDDHVEEEDAEG
jgi:hypothetical protein